MQPDLKTPDCETCGGTGRIVAANSMFPVDGVSRLNCGICAGTGKSGFKPLPDYARFQGRHRKFISDHKAEKV